MMAPVKTTGKFPETPVSRDLRNPGFDKPKNSDKYRGM
jgi:hypothetical protein